MVVKNEWSWTSAYPMYMPPWCGQEKIYLLRINAEVVEAHGGGQVLSSGVITVVEESVDLITSHN